MYIRILILGSAILVIFRALTYLNKLLPLSKKIKHYTSYLLPVIEMVSWIGFAIWCLHYVFDAEAYNILIVLGITILLILTPTWFLARDFFYGMVLKFQRKIEIDTKVQIADLKGTISRTDYFTFDIKTESGNLKTIPYNKLRSEIIVKNTVNSNLMKEKLTFNLASATRSNYTVEHLKKTLINAPWVASSHEPVIKIINKDKENFIIEVIIWVLKNEHVKKTEEWVNKSYSNKVI